MLLRDFKKTIQKCYSKDIFKERTNALFSCESFENDKKFISISLLNAKFKLSECSMQHREINQKVHNGHKMMSDGGQNSYGFEGDALWSICC